MGLTSSPRGKWYCPALYQGQEEVEDHAAGVVGVLGFLVARVIKLGPANYELVLLLSVIPMRWLARFDYGDIGKNPLVTTSFHVLRF